MVSTYLLLVLIICVNTFLTSAYHPIVFAGLYEKDFYREFRNFYRNGKVMTQALSDLLEVPLRPKLNIEDIPRTLGPKLCLTCRTAVYSALNFHKEASSTEEFQDFVVEICTKVLRIHERLCRRNMVSYITTVDFILRERRTLSSDDVCSIYFQNIKCNAKDYVIDFVVDLPPNEKESEQAKEYNFANEDASLKILHITDFHYDPYYVEGSIADCDEFICCRATSLPKKNISVVKAGKWGDYSPCDTPSGLVKNICSQAAANHENIDVVYYTGDFADHFEYNTTKEQIKHSVEFITNAFKNTFGDIPIIMMLGNHDSHPANAFAPSSVTNDSVNTKWLYEFAANQWSCWLPDSALETLRKEGHYTLVLRPGLRIIVLNNNFCYTGNIWIHYESHYMKKQLEWLRDRLQAAELAGEKVHIVGHVPPNNDASAYVWNREYRKIVLRYTHVITGQFNGHTHLDEFNIFYSDLGQAVNVAWNGGSATTFKALNPNYRIYHVNKENFEVIDHETWIFNLTEANRNPDKHPIWFKEYSFREAYGAKDLSPASLHDLFYNHWLKSDVEFKKYLSYRVKLSDASLASGCDDRCEHKAFCTISMCAP